VTGERKTGKIRIEEYKRTSRKWIKNRKSLDLWIINEYSYTKCAIEEVCEIIL